MLSLDAAYLNAMVITTQSYFGIYKGPDAAQSPHLGKAIRLLRNRLEDEQVRVSNATVMVVIILILHAHIVSDYAAVQHHTQGLRKMVRLRGGLGAFTSNNKLVIDLIRWVLSPVRYFPTTFLAGILYSPFVLDYIVACNLTL